MKDGYPTINIHINGKIIDKSELRWAIKILSVMLQECQSVTFHSNGFKSIQPPLQPKKTRPMSDMVVGSK
jgi:hypothetical protein